MKRVLAMLVLILTLILALWLGVSMGATAAQRPIDAIKETVEKLRKVLKDPKFKSNAKKAERREELKRILWARFDLEEFSRRSLGKYWPEDQKKQREFMALFKVFLENIYLEKIEQLDDNVVIIYKKERVDEDYGEVETVIKRGDDLKVNYKVKLQAAEWLVYDLVIENISIVNNYRSQFYRKLLGRSFDDLLNEMRK